MVVPVGRYEFGCCVCRSFVDGLEQYCALKYWWAHSLISWLLDDEQRHGKLHRHRNLRRLSFADGSHVFWTYILVAKDVSQRRSGINDNSIGICDKVENFWICQPVHDVSAMIRKGIGQWFLQKQSAPYFDIVVPWKEIVSNDQWIKSNVEVWLDWIGWTIQPVDILVHVASLKTDHLRCIDTCSKSKSKWNNRTQSRFEFIIGCPHLLHWLDMHRERV